MATVHRTRTNQVRRPRHTVAGGSRTSTTTTTGQAGNGVADAFEDKPTTDADQRLRTGAVSHGGATKTALPDLLGDWRAATLEATAEEMARHELRPELDALLQGAAQSKGAPLEPEEQDALEEAFFDQREAQVTALSQTHLAEITKTPKHAERAIQKTVVDRRPRVMRKRDPFTPVAQGDPVARAKERVLWENPRVMVLVDLFSPRPKALVIPKAPMMFPVEADKAILAELAKVAAHVSDAFMDTAGAPAASIWINPPQHLMVRQLHVHVQPKLPRFSPTGEPLMRAAANDPQVAQQADAFFHAVTAALKKALT